VTTETVDVWPLVVTTDVVHGIITSPLLVVSSQQAVNLCVDEDVVAESSESSGRYLVKDGAAGTGEHRGVPSVLLQARQAEGVSTEQHLRELSPGKLT